MCLVVSIFTTRYVFVYKTRSTLSYAFNKKNLELGRSVKYFVNTVVYLVGSLIFCIE